jgi:hypothetical protein
MEPGAWADTVMWVTSVDVKKMVTQERWDKMKAKIAWMWKVCEGERGGDVAIECPDSYYPHKPLESIRGFLVYVARTYSTFVPYLKGIHLTLDYWRDKRGEDGGPVDEDGWQLMNAVDNKIEDADTRQGGLVPPQFVQKATRLVDDLRMLRKLTEDLEPPRVPVRSTEVAAGYMFGDASGSGYGTSLWSSATGLIDLTYGTWASETSKQSLNFREFANSVRHIEQLVRDKTLKEGKRSSSSSRIILSLRWCGTKGRRGRNNFTD